MKPLFILSFLFCITNANAKNYYISATGNDANNGLTITTPWQSIAKVNAAVLTSGDSILFKSGDVFYGTITPTVSGLTYSAYGSGAKPTITGLTSISAWTHLGGNIWEAVVPGGLATLNMVLINGVLTPMGRYPNANTANDGYLTYESFVGNTSITDNQLTANPSWTGGEIVVRRHDFATDRAKITSHSGTTINFSTYAGGQTFTSGYGYFVENHLSTLDQNGEWFYDASTKKIKMYNTSAPSSVQVSTLNNLVSMVYTNTTIKSNVSFKGINFKGSDGVMMQYTYCNYLKIENCDLSFAGIDAVDIRYAPYFQIRNSTISDINMIGIHEHQSTLNHDVKIENNLLRKIGINAGMISSAYYEGFSSTGINISSGNLLVKENIFDSIGYAAIALRGNQNNQIIRKNIITNYCSVKNDGGAIYNSGLRGGPIVTNIMIDSNIISKAIGAMGGSTSSINKHTRAIYLDATSYGVSVLNNTIFDSWDGIYISQSQKITIKGNTIYNTGNYKYYSAALVINDAFDGYQHVRNNTITNNIFFAKYPDQLLYNQTDRYNGVDSVGIINNNYYANPNTTTPIFFTNTTKTSIATIYSLSQWQSAFPKYDINSKGAPITIPQFSYTFIGSNKSPNESFTSNILNSSASSAPVVHSLTWDATNQITGPGSAKLTSTIKSTNFTSFFQIIGAIDANKKYVLRFKTKGTKVGSFQTFLQQRTGAYAIITSRQNGSVGTGIEQHEILFSGEHTTETSAAIYINFSQENGSVYLDDVEFYEATVTPTNVDDYLRFEYNSTNAAKTITLGAKYIGVDSTVYNGTITLQPFSSAVLIKSGVTTTALKADAGTDVSLILPANSTLLKGSATQPVTNYLWTKIAGPSQYTIASPNNPSTTISNLAMGKYTFQLKVKNSSGDSAIATVNVVALGVLPVTLIDFTAKNNNDNIELQWHVASELNVSHYTIEKSSNGQNFESIGQLSANNLFSTQVYHYADNFPIKGINYYRLMMVDIDGTTKYSKVISLSVNNLASFKLNTLTLSAVNSNIMMGITSNDQQQVNLVVADVSGRILFTKPIHLQKGYNAINNKIPALNTGIYYAKLFTSDHIITKTLISSH